jgi:molecular chaperone DnaK
VRDSLESGSAEELNSKTEALTAAFQKVSEQIYAAAQQEAASADGATAEGGTSEDEEEVVDAEVVDEGEGK